MKRALLAAFVLILTSATAWAVDTIQIKPPLIAPDTPENRRMVNDVLKRSAVLASRKYGEYFTVEYGTRHSRPDYTIEIIASLDTDSAGVFEITKGDLEQSMSFLGVFKEESVGFIASIYASLWNTFTDGFAGRRVDPPRARLVLDPVSDRVTHYCGG